jgi:hypothetical protein
MTQPGSDNQPMPKDGKEIVMPHLVKEFNQMAELRYKVGLERYGKPLQTFNGRDSGQDLVEELFDACIYAKQLRMEHQSLQAENILLHKYSAFLRTEASFGKRNLLSLSEFLEKISSEREQPK